MRRIFCLSIFAVILFFIMSPVCLAFTESLDETINSLQQKISVENLLDILTLNIKKSIKESALTFTLSFAVTVTSTVLITINDSFEAKEKYFDTVSSCILILSCSYLVSLCFVKTAEHLEAMCSLMLSFVPTIVFLLTSSGSTFSSAFASSSLPLTVSLFESLCVSLLLPMIKAVYSVTCVNSLVKKANLSGFCDFLKNSVLWITGLSFTLFTGILSLGSILQSGLDNLTMRGIRYGAAKLIPIAGGMVSESMRTIVSSIGTVKNTAGVSGIVIIIFTVIPPLVSLLCAKICFSLLSCLAKSVNLGGQSTFFSSLASVISLLLSLLIGISCAFIIMFGIFIKTGTGI